ncbi:MAG: alanine racemase, partial [Phycisphaerales bacterium]|nr:alanine racemase [Phycisphaerales bacterium]
MRPSSWIEIDLSAVEANVLTLRRACAGARLCAVLKADGYAMGSVELARTLERAGADMMAVYTTADARPLLAAGVAAPILVLGPMWLEDLAGDPIVADAARRGRLHLTAHSVEQTASLETWARDRDATLPVHVEVDTGMSRGGASPDDAEAIVRLVAASDRLRLAGAMSHFASADRDADATPDRAPRFTRGLSPAR